MGEFKRISHAKSREEKNNKIFGFAHIPRRIICDLTLVLNVVAILGLTWIALELVALLARFTLVQMYRFDAFFTQFSVVFFTVVLSQRKNYNMVAPLRGARQMAVAAAFSVVAILILNYFAGLTSLTFVHYSIAALTILISGAACIFSRLAFVWVFSASNLVRNAALRVAVYGSTVQSRAAFSGMAASGDKVSLVGLFDDRRDPVRRTDCGVEVSGDLSDLIEIVKDGEVDEIIVALANASSERVRAIIDELEGFPVDVYVPLSSAGEIESEEFNVSSFGTVRVARVKQRPLRDWGLVGKWLLDRVGGWSALILGAPVFALIAIAIKLDSRGPVFFRQMRHGLCGRSIVVWKFRTMCVMENGEAVQQAQKQDPRITRVGRFLRRTSLDEIPQFINVAMGEMSIVGPRPHAVAHNQYYSDFIKAYNGRNQMKPGITGWAQINGFRGETEDPSLMERRVEHDLWYIRNWSIWLDLKVIFLTPALGLVHKNAY